MRPNDSNEIIELNVGGYNYTTSRSTILSYPDSMLSRMISGLMPTATDSKQRIFIDRDGPIFRHILNFLRDKRLNLPENFQEFAQLRQEADFYGIEPMLTYLECCYHNRLNMSTKNLVSQSMQSLVSTSNLTESAPGASTAGKGGLYFTVVSKLYQGSLESLIGCVRILTTLSALDANSKRFMNTVMKQYFKGSATTTTTGTNNSGQVVSAGAVPVKAGSPNGTNQMPLIDSFVCECKFMHEEKIICCKPCGMSGGADPNLVNLCQSIVRLAKRFGITTGYWEDMFYLTLESSVPNREQLCAKLREQHNAKLLSSAVCDRRYEENSTSTLVERWHLAEPTFACSS